MLTLDETKKMVDEMFTAETNTCRATNNSVLSIKNIKEIKMAKIVLIGAGSHTFSKI